MMGNDAVDEFDDDYLVARADAYISRRRGMLPETPLLDVPLVHTQQPALPTLEETVEAASYDLPSDDLVLGVDSATLKTLVSEVSRNISRHLTSELPELLYNSTLANLEADLRRGIVAATEVAARNFIAQRLLQGKSKKH